MIQPYTSTVYQIETQFNIASLPTGYNTSQIKQIDLITYTIKPSLFELGKMTMKSPFGNDIAVYDKERTICDIIRSRSRIDQQILNDGLKRYVKDTSKNLNNLFIYAKKWVLECIEKLYGDFTMISRTSKSTDQK